MLVIYFQQFDFEDECFEGSNRVSCATLTVGQLVGYSELEFTTYIHQLYALGPASNNLVEGESCGLIA